MFDFFVNTGTNEIIKNVVVNNALLIGAGISLLKGIAILTPNTKDDKIVTMLQNIVYKKEEDLK